MQALIAPLLAEAAPVVDIDWTAAVVGGLFLILMFILQPMLFKPWLEVRDRRAAKIDGAFASSREMSEEADALMSEYDERLKKARDEGLSSRSHARRGAEADGQKVIGEARKVAADALETERKQTADDLAKARTELQGRVNELAKDITTRVLGRTA